jgi:hypothetical protein
MSATATIFVMAEMQILRCIQCLKLLRANPPRPADRDYSRFLLVSEQAVKRRTGPIACELAVLAGELAVLAGEVSTSSADCCPAKSATHRQFKQHPAARSGD